MFYNKVLLGLSVSVPWFAVTGEIVSFSPCHFHDFLNNPEVNFAPRDRLLAAKFMRKTGMNLGCNSCI